MQKELFCMLETSDKSWACFKTSVIYNLQQILICLTANLLACMFTTIAMQTLTNYYKDKIHVIICQTLPASVDKDTGCNFSCYLSVSTARWGLPFKKKCNKLLNGLVSWLLLHIKWPLKTFAPPGSTSSVSSTAVTDGDSSHISVISNGTSSRSHVWKNNWDLEMLPD